MYLTEFLGKQRKEVLAIIGLALFVLVWFGDYLTAPQVEFSICYIIPVSYFSWFFNRRAGMSAAVTGAVMLLIVNPSNQSVQRSVWYANALTWFGLYTFIVLVISELKSLYAREKERSLTDDLTKVPNRRAFYEYLTIEKNRDRRYGLELTLAYLDLDKFKALNDRLGHAIGDRVLIRVASVMRDTVRQTDFVARIGGDEFAVLFPQTGLEAAGIVLRKLQQMLDQTMHKHGWDISFSIGAVTFRHPPDSVQEMVAKADEVMYSVKRNGANGLKLEELAA